MRLRGVIGPEFKYEVEGAPLALPCSCCWSTWSACFLVCAIPLDDGGQAAGVVPSRHDQRDGGASVQFSSVVQSCRTLCDPMNCSTPGLPVHHQLPEFTQTHVHLVSDAISHLILCRPLLLLSPITPSIRVFSNESTLCMRWPKYWSFSFSIIPSKEISGLISFRMDWLDLLAVQGTL